MPANKIGMTPPKSNCLHLSIKSYEIRPTNIRLISAGPDKSTTPKPKTNQ